ncbi:redoxin domain-containing protein [Rhizobacter sp. Root404]|uniref:redoxin domain-containing protein n=1 Tax=Rhizobacter sp. Root404 TaxID=1736528 RepID=UPI0006F72F50|nr:redoxin domain-containing protein [Rhizobacter sp. Root404]KQW36474.1 alkyl hydroperoxide reductase [Rhizobacter sp. Root404]
MTTAIRSPLAPGEPAPHFALPAVADAATVSLDDYRGRSPLFLALMVGLWCPFCRRQLVQLGALEDRLKALGVETLAVVATDPEHARLYFKFRPTRLRLASDPALTIHRAFGVPKPEPTPEMLQALEQVRVNPFGEFPEPLPLGEAAKVLTERDGYVCTPADQGDIERQWPQLKALFMIDRDGIVRWADIECQADGLAGIGKVPSEATILEAARGVAH